METLNCQCHKTARLVAEKLSLEESEWTISFQSRFGKAEWLKPYTTSTIVKLARERNIKNYMLSVLALFLIVSRHLKKLTWKQRRFSRSGWV